MHLEPTFSAANVDGALGVVSKEIEIAITKVTLECNLAIFTIQSPGFSRVWTRILQIDTIETHEGRYAFWSILTHDLLDRGFEVRLMP